MGIALQRLAAEDPSFRLHTDEESGQTIISGMGELHLEIIVDRMKREFGVEANIGRPQVTYRETLRKKVTDVEGNCAPVRRQGQYGHVVLTRSRWSRQRFRLRGRHQRRRGAARVHPFRGERAARSDGHRRAGGLSGG